MKITLVSDAWLPQVNGVVRTLVATLETLKQQGHQVQTITPDMFRTLPCPTYPEIRLALASPGCVGNHIEGFAPDAIHIATEGPLGLAARRFCQRNGLAFTTAFHTRFPDYAAARTRLSPEWFWHYLRWFHEPSTHILSATPRLSKELHERGLTHTAAWSRGVDLDLFMPQMPHHPSFSSLARPIQLYVGRVAVEKNLESFLESNIPGSKVVVGDGPALQALQSAFPEVTFLGVLHGAELVSAYAGADVFVFPSKTDTFGLVMIEALASATPVAGYDVPGPLDVIGADGCGVVEGWTKPIGSLAKNLGDAITSALKVKRADCAAYAQNFSWEASARQFLEALVPARTASLKPYPNMEAEIPASQGRDIFQEGSMAACFNVE